METTPNIAILAPILKPLADNIGMNEIQLCIMLIVTLMIACSPAIPTTLLPDIMK